MQSSTTLVRVPFRISLGGGSTDLPSYYEKHGGFIFSVAINLYMDVFLKATRSDDHIHVHYRTFESVPRVEDVQHDLARQALKMSNVKNRVAISFKADTPAGTGLGSSGACAVALLKGLHTFKTGKDLSNIRAAEDAFILTQALGLPDGVQDPYACALGGFVRLDIAKNGTIKATHPAISPATTKKFFDNTLFFYTGINRYSAPILAAQDKQRVLELKHLTKDIGLKVFDAFRAGKLDTFGELMNEHWQVKKRMSGNMSSTQLDDIYAAAKKAGALGGKLIGAGGGGYFMFYSPSEPVKKRVRQTLKRAGMREMPFTIDTKGARVKSVDF